MARRRLLLFRHYARPPLVISQNWIVFLKFLDVAIKVFKVLLVRCRDEFAATICLLPPIALNPALDDPSGGF